jgi:hypothetical protein
MSRINYYQLAPEAVSKLAAVTKYLESSSLRAIYLTQPTQDVAVERVRGLSVHFG